MKAKDKERDLFWDWMWGFLQLCWEAAGCRKTCWPPAGRFKQPASLPRGTFEVLISARTWLITQRVPVPAQAERSWKKKITINLYRLNVENDNMTFRTLRDGFSSRAESGIRAQVAGGDNPALVLKRLFFTWNLCSHLFHWFLSAQ